MIDPGLVLQGAMVAAVKANAALGALIGDRIYDRVPPSAVAPYVEIGEVQVIADPRGCFEEAVEVYVTLHVWSTAVGKPQAAAIAAALRAALTPALDLGDDWALGDLRHNDTRTFLDGDGVTTHGVVTFRADLDPAT